MVIVDSLSLLLYNKNDVEMNYPLYMTFHIRCFRFSGSIFFHIAFALVYAFRNAAPVLF